MRNLMGQAALKHWAAVEELATVAWAGRVAALKDLVAWMLVQVETAIMLKGILPKNLYGKKLEAQLKFDQLSGPHPAISILNRPCSPRSPDVLEALLRRLYHWRGSSGELRLWEIGVALADTTAQLLGRLPWLRVEAVDPYVAIPGWASPEHQQRSYETAARRLGAFGSRARLWRMDSAAAARALPALLGPVDVAFVDAAHAFCSVRVDLEAWAPLVEAAKGILAGHDWTWGHGFEDGPAVANAVLHWRGAGGGRRGPLVVSPGGHWWLDLRG